MVYRLLQIIGGLLIGLGVLWSLQGAAIVHIKPLLCVADCVELQGFSAQWLATGGVAIAVGGGLLYLARRRARRVSK